MRSPPLDVVLSELTPGPVCPQNSGPCGELHHPRAHPRQLRVCRPVQQGGGGGLARQGDQPQPPADAGTAAGHIGRVAQTRSSEFLGGPSKLECYIELSQIGSPETNAVVYWAQS